jgi:hypothetical protein
LASKKGAAGAAHRVGDVGLVIGIEGLSADSSATAVADGVLLHKSPELIEVAVLTCGHVVDPVVGVLVPTDRLLALAAPGWIRVHGWTTLQKFLEIHGAPPLDDRVHWLTRGASSRRDWGICKRIPA